MCLERKRNHHNASWKQRVCDEHIKMFSGTLEELCVAELALHMADYCYLEEFVGTVSADILWFRVNNHLACEAESCYPKIRDMFPEKQKDLENMAYHCYNTARDHRYKEEYEKSRNLYEKSLVFGKLVFGDDSQHVATVCMNMGIVCHKLGENKKSMNLYEKSLAIRMRVFGDDSKPVADVLVNMALVLNDQGEYEKAMNLYEKSLAILRDDDVADIYSSMADVCQSQGEYEKAMNFYEISLEKFGGAGRRVAITYLNMANLYGRQGKCEDAMKLYAKSLEISKKVFGDGFGDSEHVAKVYLDMAMTREMQGEYGDAMILCEKSKKIIEQVFGDGSKKEAAVFMVMACVREDQGEYEKAMNLCKKSLKIFQEFGDSDCNEIIKIKMHQIRITLKLYLAQRHEDYTELLEKMVQELLEKMVQTFDKEESVSEFNVERLYQLLDMCGAFSDPFPWYDKILSKTLKPAIKYQLAKDCKSFSKNRVGKIAQKFLQLRPSCVSNPGDTTSSNKNQDLFAQLHKLNHAWELQQIRFVDERDSTKSTNIVTEIILGILHLLDQAFGRLVRSVTPDYKGVYFPQEGSENSLKQLLIQYKLLQREDSIDVAEALKYLPKLVSLKELSAELKRLQVIDDAELPVHGASDSFDPKQLMFWFVPLKKKIAEFLDAANQEKIMPKLGKSANELNKEYKSLRKLLEHELKQIDSFPEDLPAALINKFEAESFKLIDRDVMKRAWDCIHNAVKEVNSVTWDLKDCIAKIREAQTFSCLDSPGGLSEAWWEVIFHIGNDSKHRLTPQSCESNFTRNRGVFPERTVKILIDYSEALPQIRSWSFQRFLENSFEYKRFLKLKYPDMAETGAKTKKLSRAIFSLLADKDNGFFELQHKGTYTFHVPKKQYREAGIEDIFAEFKQKARNCSEIQQLFNPVDTEVLDLICEFIDIRLSRFKERGNYHQPDFRCDVHKLLNKALSSTEEILNCFAEKMSSKSKRYSHHSTITLQDPPEDSLIGLVHKTFKASSRCNSADPWVSLARTVEGDEQQGWMVLECYRKASKALNKDYATDSLEKRADYLKKQFDACLERSFCFLAPEVLRTLKYHVQLFCHPDNPLYIPEADWVDRSNDITIRYKHWRGNLDGDLASQIHHCKEQIQKIRYWTVKFPAASNKKRNFIITKLMTEAYSMVIKLRNVLDQAFTRAIRETFCKSNPDVLLLQVPFPQAKDSSRLKKKFIQSLFTDPPSGDKADKAAWNESTIQKAEEFITATEAGAKFWADIESVQVFKESEGWISDLFVISNRVKHVEQFFPSPDEILARVNARTGRNDWKTMFQFRIGDSNFSPRSFEKHIRNNENRFVALELAVKLFDVLLNKHYLTTIPFGRAAKGFENYKGSKEDLKNTILKQWKEALRNDGKWQSFSADLEHYVGVDEIIHRLWVHQDWCLGKEGDPDFEDEVFYQTRIDVIPFLEACTDNVEKLARMFANFIQDWEFKIKLTV